MDSPLFALGRRRTFARRRLALHHRRLALLLLARRCRLCHCYCLAASLRLRLRLRLRLPPRRGRRTSDGWRRHGWCRLTSLQYLKLALEEGARIVVELLIELALCSELLRDLRLVRWDMGGVDQQRSSVVVSSNSE